MAVEESITEPLNSPKKNLPRRWVFQHGAYYYRVPPGLESKWNGKKMFRLGKTIEEAMSVFNRTHNVRLDSGAWDDVGYSAECGIPIKFLQKLYSSARCSSSQRGLVFSLRPKDLVRAANMAGGKCSLTGIKFEFEKTSFRANPWSPSLDRIDSSKGYERGNIRIVCVSVNLALGEFGEAVLLRIASALSKPMEHFEECDTKG